MRSDAHWSAFQEGVHMCTEVIRRHMARMYLGFVSCAKDIGACSPLLISELATIQMYSGCTIARFVMEVVHTSAYGLSVQIQHTRARVR